MEATTCAFSGHRPRKFPRYNAITCFKMNNHYYCVCVILDLFS